MSEYFFGLGNGKVTTAIARKVDRIAKRHGARFVTYTEPGTGRHRFWFAGPNLGNPFDRATAAAVYADLREAGLAEEVGIV